MLVRHRACPQPRRQHCFEQRSAGAARLASLCLRSPVTLPACVLEQPKWKALTDSAESLPRVCYASRNCEGHDEKDEETAVQDEAEAEPFWDRVLPSHILRKPENEIQNIAVEDEEHIWDVYKESRAVQERQSFPAVGAAVDRRSFDAVLDVYNDGSIKSLI